MVINSSIWAALRFSKIHTSVGIVETVAETLSSFLLSSENPTVVSFNKIVRNERNIEDINNMYLCFPFLLRILIPLQNENYNNKDVNKQQDSVAAVKQICNVNA